MADFKFYLSRQGPKGEPGAKGEKGDNGNTPTFSDGINTPTVYTMQIDMGDGNVFETQNLKYPMRDDGGNYLRYDRTNSTVTLSAPNVADLQRNSGEVTLASVSDVKNEDALDTDAVSMELRNADQLALSNEITRIDGVIDAVDNKVDGEIQNRQNADTALGGRIDGLDSSKADKTDVYTKSQTDALLNGKANTVHTHNLSQITDAGSLAGKNTVDYSTEVTNKPMIGDGTITITQGGVTKGIFTTNQSNNSTIELDAGGGGGATYTAGPGITINQNNEISANVDNNTIVIDGNLLKANIPDVSNFVSNTQLVSTLESYPTNNALSNAITYQTVSVPTPATYTFNRIMNLNIWEYSTNPNVETGGGWTKISTSTYTRNSQLVIPSDSSYNNGLWVTLLNLQDTECVKCNSGYTFSFECNPQITISYYSPEDGDTLITQQITINTPTNEVFNISSSSYGYTSLNIGVSKNIYIKSFMVQYSYDGNGHTPSVFLAPIYNSNGEVEVYTRSEGTPTTTTKAVIASTAVDGTTIDVDNNGKLTYVGTTGDVLPSQIGNSGKFLTTDGSTTSWAAIPQPDLTNYYTKTQTDSLLDDKISTNIIKYPLQYLTDTTDNLTYQNVNTITMIGSGRGIDFYFHTYISSGYAYVGTESGDVNLSSSNVDIVNNSSLTWFETELTNGFNFAFRQKLSTTENATVAVGHYEDGNFIPDAICGSKGGYTRGLAIYIVNTNRYYNFYEISTTPDIVQFYLTATQLNAADVGGSNYKNYVTITQAEANALNAATHIRVYPNVTSNSTITLSNIKVINPTSVTPVTDGDATARQAMFDSGINIFDAHPESLSLKYDSNTLGVNANNELYAISSTPSNMVTTNTSQTITGVKTFNTDCLRTKNILFNESGYSYGLRISSGTLRYGQTSGDYSYMETSSIGVETSGYKHQLASNGLWTGTGTNNAYTQRIGLSGNGYSYLANNQGRKFYNPAYSSATSSFTPDANTPFFMTSDLLDGTTIQYNGTSGKVEVIGGGSSYTIPTASTSTLGGVKIDGTTITIDNNGVISSAGGSAPSNMVTTDTSQDISGTKTFRVTTSNYTPTLRIAGNSSTGNNDFIVLDSNDYTNPAGVSIGYSFNLPIVKVFGGTSGAYSTFYTHNGLYRNGSDTFTFWKDYAKNSKMVLKNYQDIIMDSSMLDGTYLKWDSATNKITVDIQAIKDAIDALSNGSGSASTGSDLDTGGWL